MKYKRADGQTVRPRWSCSTIRRPTSRPGRCRSAPPAKASWPAPSWAWPVPARRSAGIMPCTVIRPGDMADNILDRDKHPEWNGERTKMVYAFPDEREALAAVRRAPGREPAGGQRRAKRRPSSTVHNREAMDEGAHVAWPERFNPDELSALQHAMNLKLQDEAAFFAEYQNEPLPEDSCDADELTADQIAAKINRHAARRRADRRAVTSRCSSTCRPTLLFYVVAGWEDDFTGYVIDYGTYPDQQRPYFTLRDARHTLATGDQGQRARRRDLCRAGSAHQRLTWPRVAARRRRDAADRACLIDANWGNVDRRGLPVLPAVAARRHRDAQPRPVRRCVEPAVLRVQAQGRATGSGHNWRMPNVQGKRAIRHVVFDTNYWKSFVHARLAVAMGDRGCLSLFGDDPNSIGCLPSI